MPIYTYKNPKTDEEFDEIMPFSHGDKPFILEDGTECPRIFSVSGLGIVDKNAECFEKDAAFVKKMKPRTIKFNDGHIEKYNPDRHC